MKSLRALVVSVSVVLVASVGLVGCSASPAPGVECTFNVQNVHKSSGSPGLMDVKATGSCSKALSEVGVKIGYQKKVNGVWQNVANSFTWRYHNSVGANKTVTVMSANGTKCVSGTYRGVLPEGYLIYNNKKYPAYQLGYGSESVVKC